MENSMENTKDRWKNFVSIIRELGQIFNFTRLEDSTNFVPTGIRKLVQFRHIF